MIVSTPESQRLKPRRGLIYLLSRVWFGTTMLALIVVYASIVSAIKPVRGVLELSEMQAFDHWLFATLVVLFCVSLSVATWTRIRWNLTNLGVLTVHAGLLILVGGSLLYFGGKIEGAALLRSPRIELVGADGTPLGAGAMLARKGEAGSIFMPVLGGQATFEVLDTTQDRTGAVTNATVRVTTGGQPRDFPLSANGAPAAIADAVGLRLTSFPPTTAFYDKEEPALYVRVWDEPSVHILPIRHLPWHRERFADEGDVIRDTAGKIVPSGRIHPALSIGGVEIPTGWFERWRMPIDVEAGALPLDIRITGYLPYVQQFEGQVVPGGDAENPVAAFTISDGRDSLRETLSAFDPSGSALDLGIAVEFVWVRTSAERDTLLRDLVGPDELEIEVLEPPLTKRLAIQSGQVIQMEDTNYELTIGQLAPSWPLMTPGFEGARSPMASVDVTGNGKRYNRTVIERFPELSQDIDEQGVRHRDGPYDPNLRLRYRTSAKGKIVLVAGPDITPSLAVFGRDGKLAAKDFGSSRTVSMSLDGSPFTFTLDSLERFGTLRQVPVVTPSDLRRPDMGRSLSAIRIEVTGRDALAGWSDSGWVAFTEFPGVGEDRPIQLRAPNGQSIEIVYSSLRHELGYALVPGRLSVQFFPGRESVESWKSEFQALLPGSDTGIPATVFTNATATFGSWTLFQSGASGDHWSYTILGVGNRRGIWPMLLGCTLITLGSLYAFYVKPVLIRRRKERALAQAAVRGDTTTATPIQPTPSEALAGAGTKGE